YYRTFDENCTPIGQDVNPRLAMVTGFGCAEEAGVARERFKAGQDFFGYALAYYYGTGRHVPVIDSVWSEYEGAGIAADTGYGDTTPFATPKELRGRYAIYEEAGVDQVVIMPQAGRNRHEHI